MKQQHFGNVDRFSKQNCFLVSVSFETETTADLPAHHKASADWPKNCDLFKSKTLADGQRKVNQSCWKNFIIEKIVL